MRYLDIQFLNKRTRLVKNILKKLAEFKMDVVVPRIATYTDAELEMMGSPVTYTYDREEHEYVPVKETINDRVNVRYPLLTIIEFFHSGFSIYIPNENDILKTIEILEEVMELAEASIGEGSEEFKDWVKEFYKAVIEDTKDLVDKKLAEEKVANVEVGNIGGLVDMLNDPKYSKYLKNDKIKPKAQNDGLDIEVY